MINVFFTKESEFERKKQDNISVPTLKLPAHLC